MNFLKLSNKEGIFKFTLEEIDEILKLKFHAKECSSAELHKQGFFSKKAVREKTYEITDENVIERYRTSEEKEKLQEFIEARLEEDDDEPLSDVEMGKKYIINLEMDSDDKIVFQNITGDCLSYIIQEMRIFSGNDYKNSDIYKENIEEYREEIEQLLKGADERYINLLKEHGYIE